MAIKISGKYVGQKRTELLHEDSGATIITDAPKDNNGLGTCFSPTDLVAAGYAACVMTTMAIYAERLGIDLTGAYFSVEKHMSASPRRIESLPLTVHLPVTVSEIERGKLERAGLSCPVHQSLGPDVRADVVFLYDVG